MLSDDGVGKDSNRPRAMNTSDFNIFKAVHLPLTVIIRRLPGSWLQPGTPVAPAMFTYRCFLPDLTGFMRSRRTGPGLRHHLPGADPVNIQPGAGIQLRYSGLRIQGTANSPSSTAKSKKWRRERDSNPRDRVMPHLLAFQASAFDQLSHLST